MTIYELKDYYSSCLISYIHEQYIFLMISYNYCMKSLEGTAVPLSLVTSHYRFFYLDLADERNKTIALQSRYSKFNSSIDCTL